MKRMNSRTIVRRAAVYHCRSQTRRNNMRIVLAALIATCSAAALAQQPQMLGDLDSKQPSKLSKQDLEKLLPGARMSRVTTAGSTQFWSNDTGGSFVVSTDNRSQPGRAVSGRARGTWRIDGPGACCLG